MPGLNGDQRRRALLLSKRLEDIAAARHNLVLQIEDLDEQAKPVQLEFNVLHNLNAATSNLPDESLAMIFEAGAFPESGFRQHLGVLVSHVSSRWRRVALATPRLWTRIAWQNSPEWKARAITFLQRSKLAPLDVTVLQSQPEDSTPNFFQSINSHLGHCRSLCVEDAEGLAEAMKHLSNAAPLLSSVNLGPGTKDHNVYIVLHAPLFPSGAPHLKTAQLHSLDIDSLQFVQPAFKSITSLRLTSLWIDPPIEEAYLPLRNALMALPSLHHLELQMNSYDEIHATDPPIVLPTVQYMSLNTPPGCLDVVTCSFIAENLLVLSLEGWDGQELEIGVEDQSTLRFPSLEHLILTQIKLRLPWLDAYARRFPDIKRLTCQVHPESERCGIEYVLFPMCFTQNHESIVDDGPPEVDEWNRWPNLEVIATSATDTPLHPGICLKLSVVKSCRPLRKLMLPDTLCAQAGADIMAQLREYIQVESFSLDWPMPFLE
ncbi:hypothetical protein HWV62_35188 [Athelia sp. TMB]|nr:hypothetical protein HWV62_35188 [Athelia sp. TMB]